MKSQSGFTLIEMVAVIIILAIMAATALPKFTSLTGEARLASLNGLAGGMRSAAALAKAKWVAASSANQDTIEMGGTNVSVIAALNPVSSTTNLGYPPGTPTGIELALSDFSGYTSDTNGNPAASGVEAWWPTGVTTSSSCYLLYNNGTVTVTAANAAACT